MKLKVLMLSVLFAFSMSQIWAGVPAEKLKGNTGELKKEQALKRYSADLLKGSEKEVAKAAEELRKIGVESLEYFQTLEKTSDSLDAVKLLISNDKVLLDLESDVKEFSKKYAEKEIKAGDQQSIMQMNLEISQMAAKHFVEKRKVDEALQKTDKNTYDLLNNGQAGNPFVMFLRVGGINQNQKLHDSKILSDGTEWCFFRDEKGAISVVKVQNDGVPTLYRDVSWEAFEKANNEVAEMLKKEGIGGNLQNANQQFQNIFGAIKIQNVPVQEDKEDQKKDE